MITDIRGGSRDFEKGGALYRLKKKILGFRWSKKAKITLEIKAFGEAFPSIFSNFLHFYIYWKFADEILSVF